MKKFFLGVTILFMLTAMIVMMLEMHRMTIKAGEIATIRLEKNEENVILKQQQQSISTQTPTPEVEKDSFATILSFGDTICHMPLVDAAYNRKEKNYDFSYMFKYVKKYFKKATISIGNCESPMAGKERGYSGYPAFNAPEHLAIDLKELGVDIMTTANNHTLDKGFSGLSSTLDFLDDAGIDHVGTARTKKEQNTILMKNLNGIKTAFLSYTYGTNGISVPKDKSFCVNLINKDLILKQIKQAKEQGAELIVASMHWGIEYQTKENSYQDDLAEFLIKNDVKIILGSHPHVLQPMKKITVKTNKGENKEGIVIFSQGNFFSNQTWTNTRNTAIFNIQIKKDGKTGKITVEKATYIPLYVYRKAPGTKERYQILDLNGIIKSYKANEGKWSNSMYQLAKAEKQRCIKIIGSKISN